MLLSKLETFVYYNISPELKNNLINLEITLCQLSIYCFSAEDPLLFFCNNGHNNVNLSPLPVGTMLSVLSVDCWRDPAGGRLFSSCFQGAPLRKLLQCAAVSSISPRIASPRRQLPSSSPLQEHDQSVPQHRASVGHCHTLSNKV